MLSCACVLHYCVMTTVFCLLYFFFSNNPLVLGENYSNFYRVLGIFAAAFKSDVLTDDDEIRQRMILILKQAQVCTFPQFEAACWKYCFGGGGFSEADPSILPP